MTGAAGAVGAEPLVGSDRRVRCSWAMSTPDYVWYHDDEWGYPLHGDDALFERMCLEAFQSGLSWLTILRKRPAFRAAFADFEIGAVAEFGEKDTLRLMSDVGIVRNRLKIAAAISNARTALTLEEGLDELLWSFAPARHRRPTSNRNSVTATVSSSAMRPPW